MRRERPLRTGFELRIGLLDECPAHDGLPTTCEVQLLFRSGSASYGCGVCRWTPALRVPDRSLACRWPRNATSADRLFVFSVRAFGTPPFRAAPTPQRTRSSSAVE